MLVHAILISSSSLPLVPLQSTQVCALELAQDFLMPQEPMMLQIQANAHVMLATVGNIKISILANAQGNATLLLTQTQPTMEDGLLSKNVAAHLVLFGMQLKVLQFV
jgi:hypothetical protein